MSCLHSFQSLDLFFSGKIRLPRDGPCDVVDGPSGGAAPEKGGTWEVFDIAGEGRHLLLHPRALLYHLPRLRGVIRDIGGDHSLVSRIVLSHVLFVQVYLKSE